GDQADRKGARSPRTFEHDRGNSDRGECEQECKRGKLDDQNGIGAKMIHGAVHGGNGKHRHCDDAQAVNGLCLCLNKSATRYEANKGGTEGAACDNQKQSESKFERRGKRRPQKDMSGLAVNGVTAVAAISVASVSATSRPSNAARAGDDIRPGADICST